MNETGYTYLDEIWKHIRNNSNSTGQLPDNISDVRLIELLQNHLHRIAKYNDTNITKTPPNMWEYIEMAGHGPRRGPIDTVITITIVYGFIFMSGIFGNVCTCMVIAKNKYMHTATNFYLFNLAIADILLLVIGLPPETYLIWSAYPWIFGEPFCIIRTMLAEMSTNASILTITAFTVERYVAICHPLKVHKLSGLKRVVRVIACIWFLACLFSIPLTIQFKVVYAVDKQNKTIKESAICGISENNYIARTFELSTFMFFIFPMSLVTVMYTFIALAIRKSGLYRDGSETSNMNRDRVNVTEAFSQQVRARRSVVKMLVAVVFGFFMCWAPFHSQRLMILYIPARNWTDSLLYIHKVIYYISGVFYFMSCTINPILYSIMSLKFRQAFKQTLFNAKCCRRRIQTTRKKAYFSYRFSRRNGYSETSFTSVEPVSPARSNHSHHPDHSPDDNSTHARRRDSSGSGKTGSSGSAKSGRPLLGHHAQDTDHHTTVEDLDIRQFVTDIGKDPTVDANRNKHIEHVKLSDIPEVANDSQIEVT